MANANNMRGMRVLLFLAMALPAFAAAQEAAAQNLPGGSWRQTCREARIEGRDTLRAECRTTDGRWNRSSLDLDRCGRGGTVANRNGELVCENQMAGLPGGSWRQSCREGRIEGRDTLRAECRTMDGRWNRTSLDLDRCGRNGAVANRNGELACENQSGRDQWWGQGLPQGSYRQSCRNARIEGRDDLVAECRRTNGNWRSTKLDIDRCRGRDIVNNNGHLECGDHRYGGNYGGWNQLPPGSWQQSCRNGRIVRDELFAECRQRDGDWRRDSIDLDDCRGQQIVNDNGRLRCGGQSSRLPHGTWQQSCRNARIGDDGRFYADCRTNNGQWRSDGIDLKDCGSRPLANIDGRLRC
ncbi:MAG: CVNH domain-containing protein [Reyranellaceae bacterium]